MVEVIFFLPVGRKNADIGVFEEELGVEVAANEAIGFDNLLEVDVNKMVVRVHVLLDQTLDLQEGGQQVPLVAGGIDGLVEALAVVEGLEEGGELVFSLCIEWRLAFARCFGGHGRIRIQVCWRLSLCGDIVTAYRPSVAGIDILHAAVCCWSFRAYCPARGSSGFDLWRFLCAC